MSYLLKRGIIGFLNTTTAIIWEGLLFTMAILATVANNNLNKVDALSKGLMIALWVLFVLFIPLIYVASANPYSNGIVLGLAIILCMIIIGISLKFVLQINKEKEITESLKTARTCYIAMIAISLIVVVVYGIYISISVYKYHKSGGLSADVQNTISAIL
jgi:hypothetical protein